MTLPQTSRPLTARESVSHLTPERWETATRLLIRKALAEFTHERLLTPQPLEGTEDRYAIRSDDGATEYRFTARRFALDHWQVEADSITRHRDGAELPLDALAFITELRTALGLGEGILPVYLEEISSTLASTAYKLAAPPVSATQLAGSGFQDIESGMTEGHPCFIANNGRLGFDIAEYRAYAPETGAPVRLVWVAARRDRATFTACADISYDKLVLSELSGPDPAPLLGRDERTGPGPGRLLPHPRPPLAVVEQALGHLRRRGRPAPPGLPGPRRRRAPRPAVHPHLLQHHPPHEALRQNGALRPQHGLPARPVRLVHGSDPRYQRLAGRPGGARRGAPLHRPGRPARTRRRRLPPRALRGSGHPRAPRI